MPKITVQAEVDLDDVIEDIDDKYIIQAMQDRDLTLPNQDEYDLDKVATLDLLREAADLFRATNKPNRGLAIDNLIEELYL